MTGKQKKDPLKKIKKSFINHARIEDSNMVILSLILSEFQAI